MFVFFLWISSNLPLSLQFIHGLICLGLHHRPTSYRQNLPVIFVAQELAFDSEKDFREFAAPFSLTYTEDGEKIDCKASMAALPNFWIYLSFLCYPGKNECLNQSSCTCT